MWKIIYQIRLICWQNWNVCVGDLEKLGYVEENTHNCHRNQVVCNPLFQGMSVVRGPAVADGVVDSNITFQANCNSHQNGSSHGHHVDWVKEVWEKYDVLKNHQDLSCNGFYRLVG